MFGNNNNMMFAETSCGVVFENYLFIDCEINYMLKERRRGGGGNSWLL